MTPSLETLIDRYTRATVKRDRRRIARQIADCAAELKLKHLERLWRNLP